jgi:hypothetical protein
MEKLTGLISRKKFLSQYYQSFQLYSRSRNMDEHSAPEWNDANNALVGFGASMVTLCYLRKFTEFGLNLFGEVKSEKIKVSEEVLKIWRY